MRVNFPLEGTIITSPLDTDFYKLSMARMIFHHYRNVDVEFEFNNRSKVPLARYIREDELRDQLDHCMNIGCTKNERFYLTQIRAYGDKMFDKEYLEFLRDLRLPPYELKRVGDSYSLKFPGPWCKTTFWEIPALAIISELYYRGQLKEMSRFERDAVYAEGIRRLHRKIKIWREHPDIIFIDFGTRRRFAGAWQEYVVGVLAEELPKQFRGSSNVLYSMKCAVTPMGTSAHEQQMVLAALAFAKADSGKNDTEVLSDAQNEFFAKWYDLYGEPLSVALTDTFGSPFFFRTAKKEIAINWKGTRQDSGDPIEYGERAIKWYQKCGVDPREKFTIFSDQLDVETMIRIQNRFSGRMGTSYGIGTNLTNDLGLKPISIVIKAARANGRSTVKLSDNLAKAMGDPKEVKRYEIAAGYENVSRVECVS